VAAGLSGAGWADHAADGLVDREPHARAGIQGRHARSPPAGETGSVDDFEDLMLLRELDDRGRVSGATVGTVDEALDFLRELERNNRGK
jgi:hypothetical protein